VVLGLVQVFHLALEPWDLRIVEMFSIRPSDLTAAQDGVIVRVADHDAASDDGVEADDGDRVELLSF